jgi:hypothetical protein
MGRMWIWASDDDLPPPPGRCTRRVPGMWRQGKPDGTGSTGHTLPLHEFAHCVALHLNRWAYDTV